MFEPVTMTCSMVTPGRTAVCGAGVISWANATRGGQMVAPMIAKHRPVLARFFIPEHSYRASPEFPANSYNNLSEDRSHIMNAVATPLWDVMTTIYTHARKTAHSSVATARSIHGMASSPARLESLL